MAVKSILNFVDNVYDRLSVELNDLTGRIAKFTDFINNSKSDAIGSSDFSAEIIKKLKEKHGPRTFEVYVELAKKELAEMPAQVAMKQSKMNFWHNIRDHILRSEDGYFPEQLANALKEIEAVPDVGMFGRTTSFGNTLKTQKKTIITSSNELKANHGVPKADPEFAKELQWVHAQLMKIYMLEIIQRNKIVWQHSYRNSKTTVIYRDKTPQNLSDPLAQDHDEDVEFKELEEVKIPAIEQWKKEAEILGISGGSTIDVERGIGIPGHLFGETLTQDRYETLIVNMLNKATGYDTDEKSLLAHWIDANGNQKKLTRFVDLLFNTNEFTDPVVSTNPLNPVPPYGMTIQRKLDQCWYVENGKIYFECEVLALLVQGPKYIYMDREAHAKDKKDCYVVCGKMPAKDMDALIDQQDSLPPLARVRGRFYLEVDKNLKSVKPMMEELVVTSYNSYLKSPERLYGPGKNVEPKKHVGNYKLIK